MKVWLVSGTEVEPGVQAWSLNHLGFATWGSTKRDVLDRVPRKLDDHLQWLTEHRLPRPEVHDQRVEVVEEVFGHEPMFGHDRQPATVGEIDLAMRLLRVTQHDLVELLNSVPDAFLSWEPTYRRFASWADWRTVAGTLAHMANAESHYYLAMVGYEPRRPTVTSDDHWRDYLPALRSDTIEYLEDLRSSTDRARVQTGLRRSRRAPGGEIEEWSVRKALRRMVRHDLLHTRSFQRIRREWERARRGGRKTLSDRKQQNSRDRIRHSKPTRPTLLKRYHLLSGHADHKTCT